jgi:hypothetical protein
MLRRLLLAGLLVVTVTGCGEASWDCQTRVEGRLVLEGWEQPEAASLARMHCKDADSHTFRPGDYLRSEQ